MSITSKQFLTAALLGLSLAMSGCATRSAPEAPDAFTQGRSHWLAKDYDQAMLYMRQAAETGNPAAQYALGYMYYNGQGTQIDLERALRWIRRAADQGYQPALEAMSQLASLSMHQPESGESGDRAEERQRKAQPQPSR